MSFHIVSLRTSTRCYSQRIGVRFAVQSIAAAFALVAAFSPAAAQHNEYRYYERELRSTLLADQARREQNASMDRMQVAVHDIGLRLQASLRSQPRTPNTQYTPPKSGVDRWLEANAEKGGSTSSAPRQMSHAETLEDARARAEHGDVAAQVTLGHIYATDFAGPKNLPAAYKAYSAAARAGNAEGQAYRGILLMQGDGVTHDSLAGLASIRLAAAQGNSIAQQWLDDLDPASVSPAQRVQLYRRAADRGDATGMYWLGYFYERGEGVPQSDSLSHYWYTRSAESGSQESQLEIAYEFANGTGGMTRDDARAHRLYLALAEGGHARSMLRVGYDYLHATGIGIDSAESLRWFKRASDAGEGRGAYEVGTAYRRGAAGVSRDLVAARRYFERGAELGYALASWNLGVATINGEGGPADTVATFKHFGRAADSGNAAAGITLGQMYETGYGPVKADRALALHWYTVAALVASTPAEVAQARAKVVQLGGDGTALDAAVTEGSRRREIEASRKQK